MSSRWVVVCRTKHNGVLVNIWSRHIFRARAESAAAKHQAMAHRMFSGAQLYYFSVEPGQKDRLKN